MIEQFSYNIKGLPIVVLRFSVSTYCIIWNVVRTEKTQGRTRYFIKGYYTGQVQLDLLSLSLRRTQITVSVTIFLYFNKNHFLEVRNNVQKKMEKIYKKAANVAFIQKVLIHLSFSQTDNSLTDKPHCFPEHEI